MEWVSVSVECHAGGDSSDVVGTWPISVETVSVCGDLEVVCGLAD